ncbi:MAG TPA: hypothetical protein VG184_11785, partial [Acidimicrobiales bacterium]|nr:hypothetical protein [Acidimicrobiales bacterium]
MDLGGTWLACEADDARRRSFPDPATDDADWVPVPVPGHWRNVAAFAASDGPLLYRRRFETPAGSGPGPEATSDAGLGPRASSDARPGPETTSGAGPDAEAASRAWLTFDGLFYQGDVWLDGSYLGDTEGYFAPQTFEVTSHMAERGEHLVAVEVACNREADLAAKRNLTGIFQHWDCIAEDWNPGGIWAPVRIWTTGPVRIATLRVTCPEASAERATLELEATLDATDAVSAVLDTTVTPLAAAAGAKPGPAGPGGHQQGPAGPGGHQQGPAGPGGHQQGPAGPGGHQQGPVGPGGHQ